MAISSRAGSVLITYSPLYHSSAMKTRIQFRVPRIHPIQAGSVQIKRAQMESRGKGVARSAHILYDREWSEWRPIFAWAIERAEGVTVVASGETARVHVPGYFPGWHPCFRSVRFRIQPQDEIGPQ